MRSLLALTIVASSCGLTLAGENWPELRGPTRDGISDSKGLPDKWSETENIVWKTPIHDKGWSSPVIWGNQIWLTTALKTGHDLFAVGIDRDSGKILHDIKLFHNDKPPFCIEYNSYASCTGAIEEGRFFAHFGSQGTACINTQTGKVIWSRKDIPCDHFRGPGSSVAIHENLIILTFDGADLQFVIALDKVTGKTVWRNDRHIAYTTDNGDYKKAYSTPGIFKVGDDFQIVSPAAEATIAYEPKTGKELWRIHHGGMNEAMRPVAGHGLIYLTSGHTANLVAVKQGMSGKLSQDAIAWKIAKGIPTRPSLLLLGDYLFMIADKGFVSCVDAKTGKQVWTERLGGDFCASPLYSNGKIFLFDEAGNGTLIAAEPEYRVIAKNKLEIGCMASPAVSGDSLFVRTKTHLYRIESKK
jgi:outer membrane protein assembly factor BamB